MKRFIYLSVLLICLIPAGSVVAAGIPDSLAIRFLEQLARNKYDSAVLSFDETMKKAIPADKLKSSWESLVTQFGPFVEKKAISDMNYQQFLIVTLTCQFESALINLQLAINSQNQISGLYFKPGEMPGEGNQKPDSLPEGLTEEEVIIESHGFRLPGTLTLPSGKGPFPVVVLVHGSGPNDRDETIGPNKPFRDIAWGLGQKGIAVLRYDKRTKIYPTTAFKNKVGIQDEVIDDVLSAVKMLRTMPETDTGRIFILGHSFGGTLAPKIVTQCRDFTGMILLAATCRPLEDIILEQYKYLYSMTGKISPEEQKQLDRLQKQVANVKSRELSDKTPSSELPLKLPASYWLELRAYNPAKVASGLKIPTLVLQGERDYQTTLADYDLWKKALSGRANVTFRLYPKCNHIFREGEGKANPGEYLSKAPFSVEVINDMANWIREVAEQK